MRGRGTREGEREDEWTSYKTSFLHRTWSRRRSDRAWKTSNRSRTTSATFRWTTTRSTSESTRETEDLGLTLLSCRKGEGVLTPVDPGPRDGKERFGCPRG